MREQEIAREGAVGLLQRQADVVVLQRSRQGQGQNEQSRTDGRDGAKTAGEETAKRTRRVRYGVEASASQGGSECSRGMALALPATAPVPPPSASAGALLPPSGSSLSVGICTLACFRFSAPPANHSEFSQRHGVARRNRLAPMALMPAVGAGELADDIASSTATAPCSIDNVNLVAPPRQPPYLSHSNCRPGSSRRLLETERHLP
jgi:hypothetical protein